MFYFLMNLLSENLAGGPQMFGILCDVFITILSIYGIIKLRKS